MPGVPCEDRGNFRAFPKRVGPRILSLERFDCFGSIEERQSIFSNT